MFKPKRKSKKKKKMIDRQTTRPRRLASERAKAYFLSDASISKQLEKEERDLRKAMRLSRAEALRTRRNGNESKSVKSSSFSSLTTSSTSSTSSSSSSSSSSPSSPLLSLPTTPKTTTKANNTASSSVNQKRQTKMGKPKAMEISAKSIKGCCKTMNQVKPINDDDKPKSKWIIRTRSQNTNDSTDQLVNYSLESACEEKEMFNCDKQQPNHQTFNTNGKINDSNNQMTNGSIKGTSSSSLMASYTTVSKDNGISGLISTSNGENCDKPRPRIMAQRKFASITYNCNTYLKPRDTDLSPIKELFTKHKPSAEDFLTFLCFKSTDLLPPHLDFYSLNNITSQDGSNVLPNDLSGNNKTANGTTPANLPIKSNLKQQPSNTITNSPTSSTTNRNLTNGKGQSVRKRAINFIAIRHPVENRKKESDLVESNKTNHIHANRKNGMKSSKTTTKTIQRTNKTVKVTARACKQTKTIKSTSTDENRPKKSSVSPLKRPKKSTTTSRHKSPTKVKISYKQRSTINSKDNDEQSPTINSIANCKISKKSQPKISNGNPENNDKRKVVKKVDCDRILRSNRSSSSASSSIVPCFDVEASQVTNGKRIKTENLDLPIMMNKPEKSAINGNPVDISDRKRKCNASDIVVENGKKRRTAVPSSETHRLKKNEAIEQLPSTSTATSISSNLRKGSIKPVPQRIETRSHTKR